MTVLPPSPRQKNEPSQSCVKGLTALIPKDFLIFSDLRGVFVFVMFVVVML
jgi:hypothetical protein